MVKGKPLATTHTSAQMISGSLIMSVILSLASHILIFAALTSSTARLAAEAKSPSRGLEVTLAKRQIWAKQHVQLTPGTSESSTRGKPDEMRAKPEDEPMLTGRNTEQKGLVSREKPVLRNVSEIDLDEVSDLEDDGYVEVEILISPEGRAIKTTLKNTNIPIEFFLLVERTFADAEFSPGKKNGTPVFDHFRFRVIFSKSSPH